MNGVVRAAMVPATLSMLMVISAAASGTCGAAPVPHGPKRSGDAATVQVAELQIPRLRGSGGYPVGEGVTPDVLDQGTGHYPGTAMPGEIGNMVVLGHRTTHLAPFRNIDMLRPGDPIVVMSPRGRFVYRVYASDIIPPDDEAVTAPVPFHPDLAPVDRILTLVTCNPKGSSTSRLVVFAQTKATPQ